MGNLLPLFPPEASFLTFRIFIIQLFGNSETARRVSAIITALSAAGTVFAITYTSAKVRQGIAMSNILPWSRLWVREHRHGSPTTAGGILLHWIFGLFGIIYTAAISDVKEAISFPGFIQVYTQRVYGCK